MLLGLDVVQNADEEPNSLIGVIVCIVAGLVYVEQDELLSDLGDMPDREVLDQVREYFGLMLEVLPELSLKRSVHQGPFCG